MKWLKRNDFVVLLVLSCLLLAIDISVRFWFCRGLNLVFNPENFNNILTPIATIISVALFVGFSVYQSRIIVSQNLKSQYQDQIRKMTQAFDEKAGTLHNNLTTFELIGEMSNVIILQVSDEYKKDIQDFQSGTRQNRAYFETRLYFPEFRNLNSLFLYGMPHFHRVRKLITDIETADLRRDDRKFILQQVEDDLLWEFMHWAEMILDAKEGGHDMSILCFEPDPSFVKASTTSIGDDFRFFYRHLRRE